MLVLTTINLNFELTAIAIIVIALGALWITLRQLNAQVLSTRASVLLALDERFGSPELREARTVTRELTDKVNAKTNQEWGGLPEEQKRARRSEYYTILIHEMHEKERDKYLRLLDSCGFLETMGHVVRFNYVAFDDVYKLFGAAITTSATIFEGHIKKMQEDDKDESLYENFLWLASETRRRDAEEKAKEQSKLKRRSFLSRALKKSSVATLD